MEIEGDSSAERTCQMNNFQEMEIILSKPRHARSSYLKRMPLMFAIPCFRFKLMKAKSARNKILAKAVNTQKRKLSKAGKL